MLRESLDETIRKDADIVATTLSMVELNLQNTLDQTNALAQALKACKRNHNTKALLDYFNNATGKEDTKSTAQNEFKIKVERESIESQDTSIKAASTDTESTLKKDEILVKGDLCSIKDEPNLMPPPTIRPKRGRKKNADKISLTSSGSSSSTRSSTRTIRSNTLDEDVICTEPNLECLTLSDEESVKTDKDEIKKTKRSTRLALNANTTKIEEMPHTRNTRTKRNLQKTEETNNETSTIVNTTDDEQTNVNGTKSTDALASARNTSSKLNIVPKADDRIKRLRSPVSDQKKRRTTKRSKSNNSDLSPEGDISEQTVYEDASDVKTDSCKFKLNAVVLLETINIASMSSNVNKTYIHNKLTATDTVNENGNLNSPNNATVIISPKDIIQNKTVVCEDKIPSEDLNGLDDIMTDDESPPQTATKSKVVLSAAHSQSKPLKKMTGVSAPENGSPVKKLVQAFEKMGKYGYGGGNKERITPLAARQVKNTTPTQQIRQYTATGSASKANPIPLSGAKAGAVPKHSFTSATVSAIKRSQQEFNERALLLRQKEEDAKKKRDQHMLAQAEERRKRAEAQDLKTLQVQQKKELLEQQKLQQLDEQQRMKDEKARIVLQEKIGKQKEELEKKRQRYKKCASQDSGISKPIYMTQHTPLLTTTDCYDSDQENANVKTTRVKPAWTTKDQLNPMLRLISILDDRSVKNGLFATKPCTPNLVDIFQDIDPIKLSRSSSAVWRKPPRATLMHLPSFTEEKEPAD